MPISHVEVLVEEPSAEAVLDVLLPRMIGRASFRIYSYAGKDNLLRKLPQRLRTYKRILQRNWIILVLIDADGKDCHSLKQQLEDMAAAVGLVTLTQNRSRCDVINRVVIEELESWYFGDWLAVRSAYPRVPATIPRRATFRNPDSIAGGTWEAFEHVMQQAGYFQGGLAKVAAAQAIAPHMDPRRNTSRSFQVFRDALLQVAAP